jgi:hypothetical protein
VSDDKSLPQQAAANSQWDMDTLMKEIEEYLEEDS